MWANQFISDLKNYDYDNKASSVANMGNYQYAYFYRDANYNYFLFKLEPGGEADAHLGNGITTKAGNYQPDWAVNNTISSFRFY